MELCDLSAHELSDLLRHRRVSAVEILEVYLAAHPRGRWAARIRWMLVS